MATDAAPPGLLDPTAPRSNPMHDIMNDPAYDPDPRLQDRGADEGDTCRICRGEGTPDEPLFYPCKCSGSIKFVHQECLMEWLSHSQKKYCELCKTPFRFTKLYHPEMPQRLPTAVFFRRAVIHILNHLVTWCRAFLVCFVWLFMLPWCMRVVWRSLFWVGDAGWTRNIYSDLIGASPRPQSPDIGVDEAVQSAVSAVSRALEANSTSSMLPSILAPFSQTLNMTAGEPTALTLIKRFFFGIAPSGLGYSYSSAVNVSTDNSSTMVMPTVHSSLLSEIAFLNSFSSSPIINRLILDVLEGQLITLVVVVAFILIFLIREWVVQQQPVINMAALGAENPREHLAEAANDGEQAPERNAILEEAEEAEAHDAGGSDWDDDSNEAAHHSDVDEHSAHFRNGAEDNISGYSSSRPPLGTTRSESAQSETHRRALEMTEYLPPALRDALLKGRPEDVVDVLENMPDDQALIANEMIAVISREIKAVGEKALEKDERKEKGVEVASGVAAEVSGDSQRDYLPSNMSSSSDRPEDSNSNFLHRPNMPSRGRSFMATKIQRELEEKSNSLSFLRREAPVFYDDPTVEQTSNHSSGSWQQISEYEVGDGENEDTHADAKPQDKGKGRAVDHMNNGAVDHGVTQDHPRSVYNRLRRDSFGEIFSEPIDYEAAKERLKKLEVEITLREKAREDKELRSEMKKAEEERTKNTLISMENVNLSGPSSDMETAAAAPTEAAEPTLEPSDATAANPDAVVGVGAAQRGLSARIIDWLWGDVTPADTGNVDADRNDEHVVQNFADEAPFVPFGQGQPDNGGAALVNGPGQDPEVVAAAAQAGIDVNDQEAIEDAEDLEGILELIGMQGPLMGLFQNACFSAVLISATLAVAVWVPYLWGKVVLLLMGSPISLFFKLPLQILSAIADFVVDTSLFLGGLCVFWITTWNASCIRILLLPLTLRWMSLSTTITRPLDLVSNFAKSVAEAALERMVKLYLTITAYPGSDWLGFSVNSHAALRSIQYQVSQTVNYTGTVIASWYGDATTTANANLTDALRHLPNAVSSLATSLLLRLQQTLVGLWDAKSFKITLDWGGDASLADPALEYWSAQDRAIAVFAGYAFFAIAGALYLRRGKPISSGQQGRRVETIIEDVLKQAGGVLKVILIISIEMLAFPLYCGILLDVALLPLFESATLASRYYFTVSNPWTSGFVHWFVGTCYMFHFALFVSMCRKIMRPGVLYFIRDPDDPTFHPVRDVLERPVSTQLRKIAFSALVYGALVIVCLGGVVWGLDYCFEGVLPIHWSSHTPAVEFPLDLLFYNFLTPLVIKLAKPSDGLHAMYKWWFRKCARALRLSDFLFGDKLKDEQGRHVRRTWASRFRREKGNVEEPVIGEDRKLLADDRNTEVYFLFDGRWVRTPASDQVRIPKGEPVFVEVDQQNNRLDGHSEEGVHAANSGMVTIVYIPPWFRVRIAFFVLSIWFFAAITGCGITIMPLQFGRWVLSHATPEGTRANDIYAFSLGIYCLGAIAYTCQHRQAISTFFCKSLQQTYLSTLTQMLRTAKSYILRGLSILYVYTTLVIVLPVLFALLLEFYVLIPVHAYAGPGEQHVIHLIQDWTLGFLYARIAGRLLFLDRQSRPARALQAVVRDGYTNPSARLATRCFVVPVLAIFCTLMLIPAGLAAALQISYFKHASPEIKGQVFRFAYPAVLAAAGCVWATLEAARATKRWRRRIRDEVYLVGERLHNFGEKRPGPARAEEAGSARRP